MNVKTIGTTASAYLVSSLLAVLIAGTSTELANVHGFDGIMASRLMGVYLVLFIPVLIVVQFVVGKSCVHARVPVVAIPSSAVLASVLFWAMFVFWDSTERVCGWAAIVALIVLSVLSVSFGVMAGTAPFRSSDLKAQKQFRVSSTVAILAAVAFLLAIVVPFFVAG